MHDANNSTHTNNANDPLLMIGCEDEPVVDDRHNWAFYAETFDTAEEDLERPSMGESLPVSSQVSAHVVNSSARNNDQLCDNIIYNEGGQSVQVQHVPGD
jgi:hypothetical protein